MIQPTESMKAGTVVTCLVSQLSRVQLDNEVIHRNLGIILEWGMGTMAHYFSKMPILNRDNGTFDPLLCKIIFHFKLYGPLK